MAWVKLDAAFFADPKIAAVGRDGAWLFVAGLCYAQDQLTDGFIPSGRVAVLAAESHAKPAGAKRLVAEGLWLEVDGGYQIARWGEWYKPAEVVRQEQAARVKGADATNHQRWHVARGVVEESCRLCATDRSTDRSSDPPDDRSSDRSPVAPRSPQSHTDTSTSSRSLSSETPGSDDDSEDPRIGVALALVAERRAPNKSPAYRRKVAANLRAEESLDVDAARLCAEYPDAPASLLAAALAGDDARNLAMYRPGDDLAEPCDESANSTGLAAARAQLKETA